MCKAKFTVHTVLTPIGCEKKTGYLHVFYCIEDEIIKKIITHIGIKKTFFLRITSLFVVDPGVLSQAELALTPILLTIKLHTWYSFRGPPLVARMQLDQWL